MSNFENSKDNKITNQYLRSEKIFLINPTMLSGTHFLTNGYSFTNPKAGERDKSVIKKGTPPMSISNLLVK